jgi:hypothetical protein
MPKIAILIDGDEQFIGAFSSFYKASLTKNQLERTTDQFVTPITIREADLDGFDRYKLRSWIVGTISIPSGEISKTLEGIEFTDFADDYKSHIAYNNCYIEVRTYMGIMHLRHTLTRLREEYLRKNNASKNGENNVQGETLVQKSG